MARKRGPRSAFQAGAWVALLLLMAVPSGAQTEILVSSANPSVAEQGTLNLNVMIGGNGFPSEPVVDFFVTGTCDYAADPDCTGDAGGIAVKKVKRQGPKALKVTVDIAEDAQYALSFDVLVRKSGQSGRGAGLFSVLEKEHPTQDTTPPGMPLDLHMVDVEFGMATIAWTMPADDGSLVESGPVQDCEYYDPVQASWSGFFDCGGTYPNAGEWPGPGVEQECLLNYLQPETDYEFRVRCVDEVDNWSPEATVVASTLPFSAFQDPSWVTEEVPIQIDGILGHGFDADGNVVIGGLVGLWDELDGGRWDVLPTVIRVITGVQDETFGTWTWAYEDVPGSASSMRVDPLGRPAFEGSAVVNVKKRLQNLVYTFNDGLEWRSEVVATGSEWGSDFSRGFAFDAEGNPAIAWCAQDDVAGVYLARRSPNGEWSIEQVSDEACDRSVGLAFDDLGNPAVAYRVDPTGFEFVAVRMARWSGASWAFETICDAPGCGVVEIYVRGLVYLPQASDFSIAGDDWRNKWAGCDRLATGWQCTGPDVVGELGKQHVIARSRHYVRSGASVLEIDPSGEIFASIDGKNGVSPSLQRRNWGRSQWTTEYVDHPSTKGFPAGFEFGWSDVGGPFVALDQSGAPTLTWNWVYNEEPAMYGLYFARKGTP